MPPTSASDASRKRKRPDDAKPKQTMSKADKAQQRIEGVPPSLTPVLLHAIKSRRRYLSKLGSSSSADTGTTGTAATVAPPPPAADPNDVLARVAARSEQEHQRRQAIEDADSPLERLRLASEDATTAFLNGVKREANSGSGGTCRSDNGWSLDQSQSRTPARDGDGGADSVPAACLSFLLGLFSTDDGSVKFPTRRAALALASALLQRSAECREAFASAERLRQFIEVVASLGSSGRDTNHNGSSNSADNEDEGASRLLVQQEAVQLLVGLSDRFGTYYPRLSVAARFLEEREGIVLSSTTRGSGIGDIASNNAMADLRRGRDMAMAKIDKAHERITKILNRADECFENLVPRFGGSTGSATGKQATQDANLANTWLGKDVDDDDDLEDDDDIDWEEGDDDNDDGSPAPEDHAKAVERTLAQMERSRGIEDGGIEISLGGGNGGGVDEASAASKIAAREMLGRCVKLLEEKHVPRLAFWSDCLQRADNMSIQTGEMSGTLQSSLVAMPPSVRKKRSETLKMVLSLKSDCAKTVSSAAKLGIGGVRNDVQSIEGTNGKTTVPPATATAEGTNNNPTGVGVATASSMLSERTSWKLALGIKSKKPKKRKIRIKVASTSSRKSAVEIKSRKGL